MTNRKIAKGFLDVTVESATTEAASFPKENIIDRTSPQRAWRSTSIYNMGCGYSWLASCRSDEPCYK